MAGKGLGALLLAMCCLLLWPLGAKAQEFVPRVAQVEAVVGDSHQLPLPVKQRMEKSVQAIGVQLLEGMKVEELKAQETHYAEIIQQVFDKVLIGYTVNRVHIYPGDTTKVQVDLIPWQDKICQVKVRVQVEGMSPVLSDMLYQDVAGIDEIFKQSLQGLPIAAVDWTQGLLKQQVNAFLQQHAPEFKADFDVVVSENTQINLVLYPLLPVVRTVDLSMHSDTVLNAGLLLRRQAMQNRVNELIGLPVSFVERHQGELENYLANVLNEDSLSHSWDVHTKAAITPGQQLVVMSRSDSDTYRVPACWAPYWPSRAICLQTNPRICPKWPRPQRTCTAWPRPPPPNRNNVDGTGPNWPDVANSSVSPHLATQSSPRMSSLRSPRPSTN